MTDPSAAITALDGHPLASTLFEPTTGNCRATLVIASATGVRRSYYRPFAEFLTGHGLRVITFDYRGIGGSAPPSLRGFEASMADWAQQDTDGVLAMAQQRWPEQPLLYVGHSFGGQALGLLRHAGCLRGAVLVASQSGYWRHWSGLARLRMLALWYVVIPLLTTVFGYLPARRLGLGEDQPRGVARQWACWGRHRDYILSADSETRQRFAELTLPIRAYSLADDSFAPRPAVTALLAAFRNAEMDHRHLEPGAVRQQRIGHFGFFREPLRDTLWGDVANWLLRRVGG